MIYLDNAATTKPYSEILDIVNDILVDNYYNPSAIYNKGINLSKEINNVRNDILSSLSAEDGTVIFTSGGTESINSAILNFSNFADKNKNIITTAYEHSATINSLDFLKKIGLEIIKVVPRNNKINIDDIVEKINDETVLVSVMHVNNEVGHIIDIEELGNKIKKKNNNTLFHVDAVQSYMKVKINVEKCKIDFLSISSHKIHGIKGTGALYIKNTEKFKPLIFGGGQEFGLRSGTDNVLGVLSLGKAVKLGTENFNNNVKKLDYIRNLFLENIKEIKDININSLEEGAKHILNVSFIGVPSEILLHDLESKNIYVSAGSACSSKKKSSKTLDSLSLNDSIKSSAIRFSFSVFTEDDEIRKACYEIKKSVEEIRKITKYNKR